jgi:hypothetical protein
MDPRLESPSPDRRKVKECQRYGLPSSSSAYFSAFSSPLCRIANKPVHNPMNIRCFLLTLACTELTLCGQTPQHLEPLSSFTGPPDIKDSTDHRAPTGFSDIEWGADERSAKISMQSKGAAFSSEGEDEGRLRLNFTGGAFAGMDADHWELFFRDGKFERGEVMLKAGNLRASYDMFRKELTKKYGKADNEDYGGGEHYATYWKLKDKTTAVQIACDVNSDGIRITYERKGNSGNISKSAVRKDL